MGAEHKAKEGKGLITQKEEFVSKSGAIVDVISDMTSHVALKSMLLLQSYHSDIM